MDTGEPADDSGDGPDAAAAGPTDVAQPTPHSPTSPAELAQPIPHSPSPPATWPPISEGAGTSAADPPLISQPQAGTGLPKRPQASWTPSGMRVEYIRPVNPAVAVMADPDRERGDDAGPAVLGGEALRAFSPPPGAGPVRTESGPPGAGATLFVANLGRAVAFYRDMLGMVQLDVGVGSAVLESGGGRIVLRRVADLPTVDRHMVHLELGVRDVHVAYQELSSKGVRFVHRPRVVGRDGQFELWSAAFRDPDGHGIALVKWDVNE